jgi:signal transduction histidine kinase
VFAALLPLALAGAVFIAIQWRQQRDTAFARLQDHARTLQRAVDRELALDQAVLGVLAASRDIDAEDWQAFRAAAATAASVRPGSWFVLYDRGGRNLVNTSVPLGTRLPNYRELLERATEAEWQGRLLPLPRGWLLAPFDTGRPAFSGIFYGPVIHRPAVASTVPVIRAGQSRYVLALAYPAEFFASVLQSEAAPEATAALWDASGRFIARNHDSERFVGLPGPGPFRDGVAALPAEGVGETPNVEGIPFVYAYRRSAVADYVIGAGMPRAAVLAPAWRALWLWLGALVAAAVVGVFFAFRLWRRVGTPLAALAHQARSLGDAHVDVAPSGIDEVDALGKALEDAVRVEQVRRATADELREANEKLRDADRRKDEFLGVLSHELRNPLAPVRNSLFILDRTDPGSDQATRAREVMKRQVSHLTRLIDDLLDVTRISRGKLQLRPADVDLNEVARRIAEDHRDLMRQARIELDLKTSHEPVVVNADEARITQIIGNLLDNARKFTGAGGRVVLSVGVERGRAAIRVRDTGAGIDPGLLPHIFDSFTQAKQPLARSQGGLGLGLSLVKGLTELHGGKVDAASFGPDAGSEFRVELPLAERAERQRTEAPSARQLQLRRYRVLVVDDNVDAAESLAELVRLLGHEVEIAYDGPTAVEKVREKRPEVVLCDIGLPGMNGYEVAQALRASHDGKVRLVAVTGYATPEDVKKATEAGFDAHVAKPPDPEKIGRLLS